MPARRIPRTRTLLVVVALAVAGACAGIDSTAVCVGVCTRGPLEPSLWATGFPQGRVDHAAVGASGYYRGVLPVGQSVTPYQVRAGIPGYPADTIRTVAWRLGDASTARVDVQPGGAVRLTGTAPGVVGVLYGNDVPMVVWSCPVGTGSCERLEGIVVTP